MRDRIDEMSNNMSEMGCQYETMMRMAQPGVPCPDKETLMSLLGGHDYMMSGFTQTMPMCEGTEDMTTRMVSMIVIISLINTCISLQPMMNSIENCAVDFLYRTRDCEFAASLLDITTGELNDVARMITENNFPIKVPKGLNITTNCKRKLRG